MATSAKAAPAAAGVGAVKRKAATAAEKSESVRDAKATTLRGKAADEAFHKWAQAKCDEFGKDYTFLITDFPKTEPKVRRAQCTVFCYDISLEDEWL